MVDVQKHGPASDGMKARMQAKAVSVPSSHMPLISHADTVVALIAKAAREASPANG